MNQTILRENVIPMMKIPPEPSESCLEAGPARSASKSSPAGEEMIPYSAKELKYLCTMWDEVQNHRGTGMLYKNIYIGTVVAILAGWLLSGADQSLLANLGGIMMFTGGLIGTWFSLKSLRQQRLCSLGK